MFEKFLQLITLPKNKDHIPLPIKALPTGSTLKMEYPMIKASIPTINEIKKTLLECDLSASLNSWLQ